MARPKYTITQQDYWDARRYIDNGMQRDAISNCDGYNDFRLADTPERLQAWCDDYLPEATFKKLKSAVLAARKRHRDYRTQRAKLGIDLDHYAHLRLSAVADELNMTLSEAVVKLEKTYWVARDAGLVK